MDNNDDVKRDRGRPRIYTSEEFKNHKTDYMLNKEWYCNVCNSGKIYTLSGKFCHLKTKKAYQKCKQTKLNTFLFTV